METTYERLRAILVKDYKLAPELVTLDAPLEALGIDSLGLADMLFNVEDEFQITLPNETVELPTISDVVTFINGIIATKNHDANPQSIATTPSLPNP